MTRSRLRAIPSVEKILQALGDQDLPRIAVTALVRRELAALRRAKTIPEFPAILGQMRAAMDRHRQSRIQPVINGTGILVHTNLGRSPLGDGAVAAVAAIAANYNNLEYDLSTGQRGRRADYLEQHLALLCGAEAATVVNNCAAALVLILRHWTAPPRTEVVISRGELIQIGGGFRIPEILEASGARLREVGTTNKTSLADFAQAVGRQTALILKVHRSNFFMDGFVAAPTTEELAGLARKKRIPFVEDLGSGAVVATECLAPVEHEPTPAEVLKRGVDLVCCSGDKLLGGPQAGIIAGKASRVKALKREPFFRALRCDKLILTALQATVDQYLFAQAKPAAPMPGPRYRPLPVMALLQTPSQTLRRRAAKMVAALSDLPLEAGVSESEAQIGGGTLPRSRVPSVTIDLRPNAISVQVLAHRLRTQTPPVLGYLAGHRLRLDLRTIFPHQDAVVGQAIRNATQTAT